MMFGRNDFEKMTSKGYTYPSGLNGTFELALDVENDEAVDREYGRMVGLGAIGASALKTYLGDCEALIKRARKET